MPSVRIWTPESDNDRDSVCCIAQKIVEYYGCDLTIEYATKQAFNDAARKPDGLKKAVDIYLRRNDIVIFLIDADSAKSQAQRRSERNSLVNRIQAVVSASVGKAILILMLQELEAWLLVDCLGICCYFTKSPETRNIQDWIKFANRRQPGQTNLIEEAELGGKNAKEYLEKLSREVLIKINPNLKNKLQNLQERQYSEDKSSEVAEYMEISSQTIKRNESLEEFAQCLKKLAAVE
ncbi:DUF4276 family protein [Argonema galeatum]|uniref:DUF4276 family protein n=1 Tax=Argonema galeatum TaxID=2942762 RepID=UPI002012EF33|nr:DUF4276 family protein [Argonema galeatum]MCL1463725.1 DUF4276 family protein [Argonema galeatum A003/A1]